MTGCSRPAELPDIVRAQFDLLEVQVASIEVVRDFPWSLVLRVAMSDGRSIWVKRCGEGMSFEPELVRVVTSVGSPILVPTLWVAGRWIATEHVDGRLEGGDAMLDPLRRLQAPFAELQRRLVPHLGEMRAAGTPTLGPADVDGLVERALDLVARDRHLAGRPLEAWEFRAFRRATPRLTEQLHVLEAAAPVTTLQHLDLHHGNVFDVGDRVRLFDWGDARLGSPLLHLVSTLSLTAFLTGRDGGDARLADIVGAYLAEWPEIRLEREAREVVHDPRLAAFVRIDALAAAMHSGRDDQLAPFADWLADLIRAASSSEPGDARGVRLA